MTPTLTQRLDRHLIDWMIAREDQQVDRAEVRKLAGELKQVFLQWAYEQQMKRRKHQ